MRLLLQSDDYGITKAASRGIVEGIKNGIIRNTGFFTSMPWSKEVYEWIKPYVDQIAFGIDVNVSTGWSILPKEEIPSLVHDDGSFLTSKENRALDTDENDHDHVVYEDIIKEFQAQIDKFIEITGKTPDYIHPHAYTTKTTIRAIRDLAKKYNIPFTEDVIKEKLDVEATKMMGWYIMPPTLENQYNSSLKDFILEGKYTVKDDFAVIICHAGYVDNELMKMSSFNIFRLKDLEGVTDPEVLKWVKDNNVELITWKNYK